MQRGPAPQRVLAAMCGQSEFPAANGTWAGAEGGEDSTPHVVEELYVVKVAHVDSGSAT